MAPTKYISVDSPHCDIRRQKDCYVILRLDEKLGVIALANQIVDQGTKKQSAWHTHFSVNSKAGARQAFKVTMG